jgi:hypothetical protein
LNLSSGDAALIRSHLLGELAWLRHGITIRVPD